MDKRAITKQAAKIVVGTAVGSFVTRAMLANVPKSERYKTAEMTGALAGWVASEKLEPYTNDLVDQFWDKRAAKKNAK